MTAQRPRSRTRFRGAGLPPAGASVPALVIRYACPKASALQFRTGTDDKFNRLVLPTPKRALSKCKCMRTQNQAEYRRLEERKRVNLPAQVDSKGVKCLAVMQDISKSGGCLFVNRMFAVGTAIEITLTNGIKRSGIVRRCLPIGGSRKFELGFELPEASWPESVVPPEDE